MSAFIISSSLYGATSCIDAPKEGWWQYAKDAFWGTEKPLPLEVLLFNKYDKATEVQKLLDRAPYSSPASIMQENEWDELGIDALVQKLDRTKTQYGKWGLKKSIVPHTDQKKLLATQERIACLLQDSALRDKLNDCMTQISLLDDALLSYFNPNNSLHKKAESLYFSIFDETLNTSEKTLEATYLFDVGKTVLALTASFSIMGIAQTAFEEKSKEGIVPQDKGILSFLTKSVKAGFALPLKYHSLELAMLKDAHVKAKIYKKSVLNGLAKVGSFGSLGDQQLYMTEHLSWSQAPALMAWGAYLALYDVGVGLNIRNSARHLASLHDVTKDIKEQTTDIAQLFRKIKELLVFSKLQPALAQWTPLVYLESFIYGTSSSSKLKRLLDLLNDPVFSPKNSSWSSRGKILLAHRLLTDIRKELVPFLQAIGHVDALLSIVNLYWEHQDKPNKFCFVEYVDSENACCDLKDFWHPRVEGSVVTNDIIIGFNDHPNKIIFTGPNGGGKSTAMESIVIGAFALGQSWGIAPASTARISMLSGIRTAINPQANITKGLSTFMAEKLRMDQITNFIKKYANKPILIILDEPFKGTVES